MGSDFNRRLEKAEQQVETLVSAAAKLLDPDCLTIFFVAEDIDSGVQYAHLPSLVDFLLEGEVLRQRGIGGCRVYFTPDGANLEPIPDWLLPREKKLDRGHFGDSV